LKKQKKNKVKHQKQIPPSKKHKKNPNKSAKENQKNPESLRKHDFRPGLQE
jgi:hypothetical protein